MFRKVLQSSSKLSFFVILLLDLQKTWDSTNTDIALSCTFNKYKHECVFVYPAKPNGSTTLSRIHCSTGEVKSWPYVRASCKSLVLDDLEHSYAYNIGVNCWKSGYIVPQNSAERYSYNHCCLSFLFYWQRRFSTYVWIVLWYFLPLFIMPLS